MVALADPPPARPHLTPDEFFAAVAPVVERIAGELVRRTPRLARVRDELVQAGLIEAWKIAPEYDASRSNPETFAGERIRFRMIDCLRAETNTVGASAKAQMDREREGRKQIACFSIDASKEHTRHAVDNRYGATSGGRLNGDDPSDFDPEPCDGAEAELLAAIRSTGAFLNDDTRQMLIQWATGSTMREIGAARGLSESRVSQLIQRGCNILREAMEARGLRSF